MKFPALIVVAFFSFIFSSILFTSFAFAQTPGSTTPPQNNIHTITQSALWGMMSFVTCALDGVDFVTVNHKCISYNSRTGQMVYASNDQGLIGIASNSIAFLYNSPLHTSDFIAYMGNNFGLVKKAQAAPTTGFQQLNPVLKIWVAFRNVAFLLFILLFVGVGFAIMLRAKIDPRTVMTIENQIPKLIVALLLITFSYAIAGLVIDVMWVVVYISINIFASIDPELQHQLGSLTSSVGTDPFSFVSSLSSGGFFGIISKVAGSVYNITFIITKGLVDNSIILKVLLDIIPGLPLTIGCIFAAIGNGTLHILSLGIYNGEDIGTCLSNAAAASAGGVATGISFIIFTVALVVALAKLWWTLIKSYTLLLVYVIFAPFFILMGLLPGSKANFENWIRHVAAYLFVFPMSMGIFLLAKVLMDVYSNTPGFVPPLIGIPQASAGVLGPLLGFAILMLAPQALQMTQDALNAPDMKYLPGIGQAIGVGAKYYGGLSGGMIHRAFRAYDPYHNLDEGFARKWVFGDRNNVRGFRGQLRKIVFGKEVNGPNGKPALPPNPGGGGHG